MSFPFRSLFFVVLLTGCARNEPVSAAEATGASSTPPNGLYRAKATMVSDTCAVPEEQAAGDRRIFVTFASGGPTTRANLPLTFDGLPWEELASRTTFELGRTLTLVEAPAPRCPALRRRRDIRVQASRATSLDLDVVETWSVPDDPACELPDSAPRASCTRVRRIVLQAERECTSPAELISLQCLDSVTR